MLKMILSALLLMPSLVLADEVTSGIDYSKYKDMTYVGVYADGETQVVIANYFTKEIDMETYDFTKPLDADACEVYYKRSGDDFYLQGWAMKSSPELCWDIANGIVENLISGDSGTFHKGDGTAIDTDKIFWGNSEELP